MITVQKGKILIILEFLFGRIFATCWQKRIQCNSYRGFLWKKSGKVTWFWGKKYLTLPYLDNTFQQIAKNMAGFLNYYTFLTDLVAKFVKFLLCMITKLKNKTLDHRTKKSDTLMGGYSMVLYFMGWAISCSNSKGPNCKERWKGKVWLWTWE